MFPQVLDPATIEGGSPHVSFSQGMLGWQVQVAQSPTLNYKGLLLLDRGRVLDNTCITIEFRKQIVFISVLEVSLSCIAGPMVRGSQGS